MFGSVAFLQHVATEREERFVEHAEVVGSRVLRTDADVVWVGFEREGWQEVEIRALEADDVFVEGESLTVLVDRSDPATAHLPGDLLDYFESTVARWLLSYGLALGMVLLSACLLYTSDAADEL